MTVLRLVGALLLAVLVSGSAPTVTPTDEAAIAFHFSRFSPDRATVPAGVPIHITLNNDDPIAHEWIVGPASIHEVHRKGTEAWHEGRPNEVSVPPYASRVTTVVFDQPGEFAFVCHLPGHEEYGMKGLVTVVSNSARVARAS